MKVERVAPVGPEEAGERDPVLGVARGIEHVARGARPALAGRQREECLARRLIGGEAVVQRADGVGRIHHLQDEVGERLHVRRGDGRVPPEQADEGDVELLERRLLVEGAAVRLRARRVRPRRCGRRASASARGWPCRAGSASSSAPSSRRTRRDAPKVAGSRMNGPGIGLLTASGSPRSHDRLSRSPKTWQLAQAESPWLEVNEAS